MTKRVAVIGAGIIGAACAYELHAHGFEVVMIDPGDREPASSKGNAGALAYAEVLPIASGRILRNIPKWLLDPLGPLSINPRYLGQALPWFFRFALATRKKTFDDSVQALARLNFLSRDLCQPLYQAAEIASAIRATGALHLYENEREFQRTLPGWGLRAQNGIKFRHIGQAELLAMEPALSPIIIGATALEDWFVVSDPQIVLNRVIQLNRNQGVTFINDAAVAIKSNANDLAIEIENGDRAIQAEQCVLAAGAWSGALALELGDQISLEAERGYNTTISEPGISINSELIFGEHGFVATNLQCGLRIGGAAEFAGLAAPPNYARSEAMLNKAKRFLPGLRAENGVSWMGCRPSTPDNRPIIGRSMTDPRILYACGHGHLGLTQAPGTARLIAQLACGQEPSIDIKPYAPDRFLWRKRRS